MNPSAQQIRRLYKHLFRYGQHLRLTDQTYFLSRIRNEFKQNRNLTVPEDIDQCFKRGQALLQNGRVV